MRNMCRTICRKDKIKNVLFKSIFPSLVFYALVFTIMHRNGFRTMEIIRDFAQIVEESSFLGFLSTIGTWLWVSSAAIAFFGFIALNPASSRRSKELMLLLGILSFLLAFDDFFMIHDRYIDQNICYAAYAIMSIAILFRHFTMIVEINGFAFFLSGTLLALSILTDIVQDDLPFRYTDTQIVEEGFKFVGASTWLYVVGSVVATLSRRKFQKSSMC